MSIKLDYYLEEGFRGNAKAAYLAAKALTSPTENTKEYDVQKQFKRSADLGYIPAQRILGIYGLFNHLMTDDSTPANIHYNRDRHLGFEWLNEAACSGDLVATYFVGKCYQYGMGVPRDEERANAYLTQVGKKVSFDVAMAAMLLFEFLLLTSEDTSEDTITAFPPFDNYLRAC